jgi:hypothetical protein
MGAIFAAEIPEGEFDAFHPANIAEVVGYLASDQCPFTGRVFAVQGGAISLLEGWHTAGIVETDGPWDAHTVGDQLKVWS